MQTVRNKTDYADIMQEKVTKTLSGLHNITFPR